MKEESNLSALFDRLNDLKSVFRYGQTIIPVIQSLIDFMKDIVPLLENINNSISDSARKIPRASTHIDNVTNATELATTEILDIVDIISGDISKMEAMLSEVSSKEKERKEILLKVRELTAGVPEVMELLNKYFAINYFEENFSSMLESFVKIKNDALNITLSLQVQDITSQQLAAVNHLISSVQEKLTSLLINFEGTAFKELEATIVEVPENAPYNPNASYDKSPEKQHIADSIFDGNGNKTKTSQQEIDKLFG